MQTIQDMLAHIERRARAYVDRMPGSVRHQGLNGSGKTWAVAIALARGFALPESTVLSILQDYNERCEPPWTLKELKHKASDACQKSHLGCGYLLDAERHDMGPEEYAASDELVAAMIANDEERNHKAAVEVKPEPMAEETKLELARVREERSIAGKEAKAARAHDLLARVRALGGLCESFGGWLIESSLYPQPEIAVGAILSLGSALFQRRCVTAGRGQLSTYILAIAKSGHGKGRPQECIEQALMGWPDVKGAGDFSSTKSTFLRIKRVTDGIGCGLHVCSDEYGAKFSGWVAARNGYQSEIRSLLLELGTKGMAPIVRPTSAQEGAQDISILAPCLSIFGSTTPESIDFRSSSVADGLAGRHLIFFGVPRLPQRNHVAHESAGVPQSVKDAVERIRLEHKEWSKDRVFGYDPMIVAESEEVAGDMAAMADALDDARRNNNDELEATLSARSIERVRAIGCLLACMAEVSGGATVKGVHYSLACEIVEVSMANLAEQAMAAEMRSSEFGRVMARVLGVIMDNPSGIRRMDVLRKIRSIDSKTLDSVIETLVSSGSVEVEKEEKHEGRGRATVIYRSVD